MSKGQVSLKNLTVSRQIYKIISHLGTITLLLNSLANQFPVVIIKLFIKEIIIHNHLIYMFCLLPISNNNPY